jgi:hypothetical protein
MEEQKALKPLEGCKGCFRIRCPWLGNVAGPQAVQSKVSYGCNSIIKESEKIRGAILRWVEKNKIPKEVRL